MYKKFQLQNWQTDLMCFVHKPEYYYLWRKLQALLLPALLQYQAENSNQASRSLNNRLH